MRPNAPEHTEVALDNPEMLPCRRRVLEMAQRTTIRHRQELLKCGVVLVGVADHQYQATLGRQRDELLGLCDRGS